MALERILDQAGFDNLPPSIREHYNQFEENGNIQYKLDAPSEHSENVDGLKSALKKERDNAKALEKTLRQWQKELGGDTPKQILENLNSNDPKVNQRIQELLEQKTTSDERTKTAEAKLNQYICRTELTQALLKHSATPEAVELLIPGFMEKVRLNKKGSVVLRDKKGQFKNVDEFVKAEIDRFPQLQHSNRRGGSGTPPGSRGSGTSKTITRFEFDSLSGAEQQRLMLDGDIEVVD